MNGESFQVSNGFGLQHGMQMRSDSECRSKEFQIEFPKNDAVVEFQRKRPVGGRIQELFFLRSKP